MLIPKISVVLSDGCAIASTLANCLSTMGSSCQLRSTRALDSWETLSDLCRGADVVFLLSALDLKSSVGPSELQEFKSDVGRVLECCQECGVGGLVFTSSSCVVTGDSGLDLNENQRYVSAQEDPRAHAIAMAEVEVLKASGTHSLAGSSCLYTCALRPSTIYGPGEDRSLKRALNWVGYGLNHVALGPESTKRDLLYTDNLVEAQLLAGANLISGSSGAGQVDWGRRGPACSGQAYFVTDGQPCNPQSFFDDVMDGLDFPTSKLVRLPTAVAHIAAWLAEAAYKGRLSKRPLLSRAEVRLLTESCTYDIGRTRKDLGYKPRVSADEALRKTVESLRRHGWRRHTVLVPALGYWIANPTGVYLATLAAFGGPCPAVLQPLAVTMQTVGLVLFRKAVVVQAICWAAYLVHLLEGVYAFRLAQQAGHRDTAPLWFLQTLLLGFPSTILIRQLLL